MSVPNIPTRPSGPPVIKVGQRYRNVGLEGQPPSDDIIVLDYHSNGCQIAARVIHTDEPVGDDGEPQWDFITISSANFMAALQAGWLVSIEE